MRGAVRGSPQKKPMTYVLWIVLFACAAAAWSDLRTQRIPNVIPIALALSGAMFAASAGWQSLLTFAGIAVVVFLGGATLFSMRLLGGGDVKLLAAAGAALGPHDLAPFLLGTVLCGGAIGIVVAALRGRLHATVVNLQAMALPMLAGGPLAPVSQGTKMPYGLAIFAGALIASGLHLFNARPLP